MQCIDTVCYLHIKNDLLYTNVYDTHVHVHLHHNIHDTECALDDTKCSLLLFLAQVAIIL